MSMVFILSIAIVGTCSSLSLCKAIFHGRRDADALCDRE